MENYTSKLVLVPYLQNQFIKYDFPYDCILDGRCFTPAVSLSLVHLILYDPFMIQDGLVNFVRLLFGHNIIVLALQELGMGGIVLDHDGFQLTGDSPIMAP